MDAYNVYYPIIEYTESLMTHGYDVDMHSWVTDVTWPHFAFVVGLVDGMHSRATTFLFPSKILDKTESKTRLIMIIKTPRGIN